MMLGAGATLSVVMTAFRYTNGLRGYSSPETDEEEVERRENAKKLRRRPISETIEQLGEGRGKPNIINLPYVPLTIPGIYAPGYEERRRQRLMDKYGIDVKAAQETS
jgi:hypothetical protein